MVVEMGVHGGALAEFADLQCVVCLVGSEGFFRAKEPEHPYVKRHYSGWEDPERRLSVLIEGHIRMTHRIAREADALGVRRIVVDRSTGLEEVYGSVKAHFGLT
jgi:hypothetical protein